MPLQDIKYVMSVDDGQAKAAIKKTVGDLKTLDKESFGGGNAAKLTEGIQAAGAAASGALSELGEALTSALGGSALSGAAIGAVGQISGKVAPVVSSVFSGMGVAGGAAFGAAYSDSVKNLVAGLGGIFSESAGSKAASAFGAGFLSFFGKIDIARYIPKGWTKVMVRLAHTELYASIRRLKADLRMLGKEVGEMAIKPIVAGWKAVSFAASAAAHIMRNIGPMTMAGLNVALGGLKAVFAGISKGALTGARMVALAYSQAIFGVAKVIDILGAKMVETIRHPLRTLGGLMSKTWGVLRSGASGAWAAISGISSKAVWGIAGAATAALAVVAGGFFAIAHHARESWAEVNKGIMTVKASMVGFGKTVEQAFNTTVTDKIMAATQRVAIGLGAMPDDVSAATGILVKNGMQLDAALARMGLVANMAKVNNMSMHDAAEKLVEAWNGEVEALEDLGIRMESTGDIAKDADILLAKLQQRYGNMDLSKQFLNASPIEAATAAIKMLWVNLGRTLDPAFTAAAQALADVMIGIADSLDSMSNSDFMPTVSGVLAAIGETVTTIINATVVVSNVFQMVWTGIKSMGQSIWYGFGYAWAWLQDKLATLVSTIGEAVSYIPGTGDAGEGMMSKAKEMQESAKKAMAENGKAFADAAMSNGQSLMGDMKDIQNALAPDGGVVGQLQRQGRAAREKARQDALAMGANAPALPQSDKVREDKANKDAEEAKKKAEEQAKKDKQTFESNQKIQQERDRFARNRQRTTIVLQTPQRYIPALRHGR